MNIMSLFKRLKDWGPLLFAIGFIAPLVTQSLLRANIGEISEPAAFQLGFAVAIPLGLLAKIRGTWI